MPKRQALVLSALLLIAVAAAIVLFRMQRAPQPQAPIKITLASQQLRLPNGLVADLVAGDCGNEGALVLLYGIGTEHDPEKHSGLANLIGRLLSFTADAGHSTVEVTSTFTQVSLRLPSTEIAAELARIAQRMQQLPVDPVALDRARKEQLEEVARRKGGDARLTAIAYANESVHSARAEGYFGGIAKQITATDLDTVTTFWKEYYQPVNLRIVLVGSFDAKAMAERIQQTLGVLPAGKPATLREHGPSTVSGTLVMGDNPSVLAFGVAPPPPTDALYAPFLVLAARLQSNDSQQFDYDALTRSDALLLSQATPTGQRPEPVADTWRAKLTQRLAQPLTPNEIATTKQRFAALLGENDLDPATCKRDPSALAVARAHRARQGIDPSALGKALSSVTDAQLQQARTLFSQSAIVAAGGEIR
jgi:predicted Zn-dependent peptidase